MKYPICPVSRTGVPLMACIYPNMEREMFENVIQGATNNAPLVPETLADLMIVVRVRRRMVIHASTACQSYVHCRWPSAHGRTGASQSGGKDVVYR
jgi:uncharacterized NAD(P)/FAD-binding protein YdhS